MMVSSYARLLWKKLQETLKFSIIYIVLIFALAIFGYVQRYDAEEEVIPSPPIPLTQIYSLEHCKTCDYDGCVDAPLFTKLFVDRARKSYKLFSFATNNQEYEYKVVQPEVCSFGTSEGDPFSFSCQSSYRIENAIGKISIRLEHNRLTLEKEHQPRSTSNYFHSTTTCPINFPLM